MDLDEKTSEIQKELSEKGVVIAPILDQIDEIDSFKERVNVLSGANREFEIEYIGSKSKPNFEEYRTDDIIFIVEDMNIPFSDFKNKVEDGWQIFLINKSQASNIHPANRGMILR